MGITSSNKVVDRSEIQCDGQLKVTLALTASPDIIENPTDIVLVPDRSGSMAGVPLAAVKEGADTFIDIIQQATSNGGGSGELGSGTKMGVVSFATTARQDTAMITSVADLKGAVNALVAGGSTNHGDAFAQATELLETGTNPVKVMVMFTDGNTTAGPPPAPIADLAKAKGIIIYCIGLVGTDGLDVSALNDWATDPDSIHVAIAPTPADLEEIFAELAANLTKPGATDLKIVEEVNPDFEITEILPPDKGTVEQQTDTKLTWRMDSLGVDAGEIALDSVGRILQVDVTVKDVCPDRRVSLAMILTEVDDKGEKETKGVKVLTIPAHQEMGCRDVLVRCVRFAEPEDGANLCATRKFQVQTFAHYMDSDFVCCPDKE